MHRRLRPPRCLLHTRGYALHNFACASGNASARGSLVACACAKNGSTAHTRGGLAGWPVPFGYATYNSFTGGKFKICSVPLWCYIYGVGQSYT